MKIWKDIKGYENLYQVSSEGRVKSLGNGKSNASKERVLKPYKTKGGYLVVSLSKDGKQKLYYIHRLVATAFITNPNNLSEVNHKNEDKTDNRIENLEWCTSQYNNNFGTHNERMAKSKSIPILQFTKNGEFIRKWDSAIQAERELGFCNSGINKNLKGKLKSAYGYIWMNAVINGFTIDINKLKKVA